MDFKDLFGQKLATHQEASAAAEYIAAQAREDHGHLVRELEPRLKALVLEAFAALKSAGLDPIKVVGTEGVKAYALGYVSPGQRRGGPCVVTVAIDSEGHIALGHEVEVQNLSPQGPARAPASCHPLDKGFSDVLKLACRDDKPVGATRIHLNSAGEIMLTERHVAGDDYQHRRTPLAEYLADLGVKAVAGF